MSFVSDSFWPARLLALFQVFSDTFQHSNGPLVDLLQYCFGGRPNFRFYPRFSRLCDIDRSALVEVLDSSRNYSPALIAVVGDGNFLDSPRFCFRADLLIRFHMYRKLRRCPLPYLYGVSLIGIFARFYRGEVATGNVEPISPWTPCYPDSDSNSFSSDLDYLNRQWELPLLSQAGFDKMKEIVLHIMGMDKLTPKGLSLYEMAMEQSLGESTLSNARTFEQPGTTSSNTQIRDHTFLPRGQIWARP